MSFFGSDRMFLIHMAMLMSSPYGNKPKRKTQSSTGDVRAYTNGVAFRAGRAEVDFTGLSCFGANKSCWSRDWRNA